MKTFNVYKHPTMGFQAVKVGFSWPALVFHIFWMLSKKLWEQTGLWLGAYIVCCFIENVIDKWQEDERQILVYLILLGAYFTLWFVPPFRGNKWRERNLLKRGYELLNTVQAETPDAAVAQVAKSTTKGSALKQAGKYQEAIEVFDKVIEASPDDPAGYCSRGECLLWSGKLQEAIRDFDMAISLKAANVANAYWYSAVAYLRKSVTGGGPFDEMEGTTRMRVAAGLGHKEAQDFIKSVRGPRFRPHKLARNLVTHSKDQLTT